MSETNNMQLKRNTGADIIRCLAFCFVVSVHFLLNNGFYSTIVSGERMLIMVFMRSFFIICVPLYMLLSGYLMRNKGLSIGYYKKIGKTYLTYVLAAVCCVTYSAIFVKRVWTVKSFILAVLDFGAAPYSWYVEMYLGLFLIIPFLNILYNNLPSKNWKKTLILMFIILTALPVVFNVYNFNSVEWWLQPSLQKSYSKLIPDWWISIYPITYYFIGCYISEFGLKMKKSVNILLIIATWVVSALYNFWRSRESTFIWGSWCGYGSIFIVILATLVFAFFINLNYDKFPPRLSAFFKNVSALCLGSYLVSWIFDKAFYKILIEKVPKMTDRLGYFIIIVPSVIVCSLILSFIISKVQLLLEMLFAFIKSKFVKSKAV